MRVVRIDILQFCPRSEAPPLFQGVVRQVTSHHISTRCTSTERQSISKGGIILPHELYFTVLDFNITQNTSCVSATVALRIKNIDDNTLVCWKLSLKPNGSLPQ